MNIAALSIDALCLRELQDQSLPARVHSVFERVINIVVGEHRLLTLAQRGADDAPASVRVDLASWAGLVPAAGGRVRLEPERIVIDKGPCIDLTGAEPWHGALPRYTTDEAILCHNLPLAREHLGARGKGAVGGHNAARAPNRLDRVLFEALRRSSQGLCRAIVAGDERRARQCLSQLIGLGPGLTPAGDDFLVGLLAVLNLPDSPCQAWRRIGEWVVDLAARQTHLISAAALRHAAAARVRACLVDLCLALMHASPAWTLRVLDEVLAIGSGSGSDIAAGMLAGFELHLNAGITSWETR